MKVYDESWNELTTPDLSAGWLEDARRLVAHHEAEPGSPAEYGWQTLPGTETLCLGGLRQRVEVTPAVPAKPAWDEYEDCQVYHPYTPEQLAAQNAPTQLERMEAQLLYTALMTDTLIGEVAADA